MIQVAPVGLQYNPRTLWFDPAGNELHKSDAVIVRTERGLEFGHMTDEIIEVSEEAIEQLNSPLKPVVRLASDEDKQQALEMEQRGKEALPMFREIAAQTNEDMNPIMVEYLFDGDKAIFYFSAEDRVDFRELVRRLAAHFHVRVDMRQIGVRDEARMVGGLGHCGQELCCKRLGGEFCPVSIRMAKEQDLSLNPQKISGVCGRLMCCLRYEFDAYKEFKSRAPKVGAKINTPDGEAKVVELNVPREIVSLRDEEGKLVKVPLKDFEPAEEGCRPHTVNCAAYCRCKEPAFSSGPSLISFSTPSFSGEDKLARRDVSSTENHQGQNAGKGEGKGDGKGDVSSRRSRRGDSDASRPKSKSTAHRSRRNRTHGNKHDGQLEADSMRNETTESGRKSERPRPGQRSSALREGALSDVTRKTRHSRSQSAEAPQNAARADGAQRSRGRGGHRKSRHRSHRSDQGGETAQKD